jgi:hypothetical protein
MNPSPRSLDFSFVPSEKAYLCFIPGKLINCRPARFPPELHFPFEALVIPKCGLGNAKYRWTVAFHIFAEVRMEVLSPPAYLANPKVAM